MKRETIIITGGSSGFGLALVKRLAHTSRQVCILDVKRPTPNLFIVKPNVFYYECDVSSLQALESTFSKVFNEHGSIDVVYNNAGIADLNPLQDDLEHKTWIKVIETNLVAVIFGTQLAFKYMSNNPNGGVIVNTASIGGIYPLTPFPVYTASKHGVVGFTRSFQGPLSRHDPKIRVCAVAPTFSNTPLVQSGIQYNPKLKDYISLFHMIPVEMVVDAMERCLNDITLKGDVLLVTHNGIKVLPKLDATQITV